jgi:hypothetical protein
MFVYNIWYCNSAESQILHSSDVPECVFVYVAARGEVVGHMSSNLMGLNDKPSETTLYINLDLD